MHIFPKNLATFEKKIVYEFIHLAKKKSFFAQKLSNLQERCAMRIALIMIF